MRRRFRQQGHHDNGRHERCGGDQWRSGHVRQVQQPRRRAASRRSAASATSADRLDSPGGATSVGGNFKPGGTVAISNEQGQTWPCQFNPFNPAVNSESLGFVYEPLVYVDALKSGAETPMLASSYTWSADQKSIVFTIRNGVKWNDGQPFTAADVAYTFNLMKKNPALDLYALWTGAGLTSVTATGNKVTMAFNQPAKPYFYNFADQVGIVPEHIFSTGDAAAHPDTWADKAPGRHRTVHGQPVHARTTSPTRPTRTTGMPERAAHPEGEVPRLPRQRAGQPRPRHRQGAVGQPVHPEHPVLLPEQVQGQPHLVPADAATSTCSRTTTPATRPRTTSPYARRSRTPSTARRSPRSARAASSRRPTRPASCSPTFQQYFDAARA